MEQVHVYQSNRLELLFENLKKRLFESKNPFARRLLIAPSPAMKSWLMQRMATDQDLQIAMGIEFTHLDQTLLELSKDGKTQPIPSILALSMALEAHIRQLVLSETQSDIYEPLFRYLKVEGKTLSRKGHRRLCALSERLAFLFIQYGKYAGREVVKWENDPQDWQEALWRSFFQEKWSYLYRDLSKEITKDYGETQVHLFGLNFVSKLQYSFLKQLSKNIPVSTYVLSPCKMLWSDLLSDRESQKMTRSLEKEGVEKMKIDALEEFLADKNPLLANFGRLGREMADMIEDNVVSDDYVVTKNLVDSDAYKAFLTDDLFVDHTREDSLSMLEAVQADMLFLRNPSESDKLSFEKDTSIQIHVATSPMREVEALYHNLMHLLETHSEDETPLYPEDVTVLAPDIREYEPYIKAVFGDRESQLDYKLMDVDVLSKNSLVQGFVHFLSLPLGRWDSASVMQLFDTPSFNKKQGFSKEDVQSIHEWVRIADIRWGDTADHRDEILLREHCQRGMLEKSGQGTFSHGINRLLLGMVAIEDETCDPITTVQLTQSELFGQWVSLLRSLKEDLDRLIREKMSASKWAATLKELCETYFDCQDDEVSLELFSVLDKFDLDSLLEGELFSFTSIKRHLDSLLQRNDVSYRESHLSAVKFCSMLPMRAIPSKIVVLLGLHEGAYPKQEQNFSLNKMIEGDSDFCPTQTDYDRFLFLETVLSARRYFIMSFLGYSKSDGKKQPPSLLIDELVAYLDHAFLLNDDKPSEHIFTHHSFYSFDQKYFDPESSLKNYSQKDYKAALAFYSQEKKDFHAFVPEFTLIGDENKDAITVELRHLVQVAKNPIQAYFNHALNIYLNKDDETELKQEEDLHLSALDNAIMISNSVVEGSDKVIDDGLKKGRLPVGAYKEIAIEKIRQESEIRQENLMKVGVDPKQLFELDFNERPLEIVMDNGRCVSIVGVMKDVSPLGLITQSKDDKKSFWHLWPEFLILNYAQKMMSLDLEPHLIYARTGSVKKPFFEDPTPYLKTYLQYFFDSMSHVSPLIPDWITELAKSKSVSFESLVKKSLTDGPFNTFYNDYARFMLRGGQIPQGVDVWQQKAQDLFSELEEKWGKK